MNFLWDKAISSISQLDGLYENGTVTQKRKIIGSMFPEKLTFDGFQYRTPRVNEALTLMLLIGKQIQGNKKGTNPLNSDLSHQVTQLVQNSNQLLEDLKLLNDVFAA